METTSLELSRKLASVMKGESYFVWGRMGHYPVQSTSSALPVPPVFDDNWMLYSKDTVNILNACGLYEFIDTYTLSEILKELPKSIEGLDLIIDLSCSTISYDGMKDAGCGCCSEEASVGGICWDKNESIKAVANPTEAAGQLLLWVHENGFMEGRG